MDGNATSFAVGLLILWLAAVSLFFALHPGGVAGINNPVDALKWMISEFQGSVTGTASTTPATTTPNANITNPGTGSQTLV